MVECIGLEIRGLSAFMYGAEIFEDLKLRYCSGIFVNSINSVAHVIPSSSFRQQHVSLGSVLTGKTIDMCIRMK